MKRIFFVTLAVCLCATSQAQVKIGIKGAPQLTWSNPDNKSTSTNGTRLNAAYGLMLQYYFSENYGIGTEICINSYGTNLNLDKDRFSSVQHGDDSYASTEDLIYDYRLRYIQIPLILTMRTKEIGYLRYYAEAGLSAGFLIRSKADVSMAQFQLENVNINEKDPEDRFVTAPVRYDDEVRALRASFLIGAGVQYNIFGNSLLVAGLRYDNGLTGFTKDDRWKTSLNSVALNVGVLF